MTPVNVFISYASERRAVSEEIALALRGEGHEVFFDRTELPEGDAYNRAIREAIGDCDLVVFLVSPESVAAGRYTLTELKFVEQKWRSPAGRVLPVLVQPTDAAQIPAYLRAVVLLRPHGSVAAEVVDAVERLARPRWRRSLRRGAALLVAAVVLVAGFVGWRAVERARECGRARSVAAEGRLLQDAEDYGAAWERYAAARATCPGDDDLLRQHERLAMDWLDNIRVAPGQETFSDIVRKVQPLLAQGAGARDDRRAADALAHLGWGDFLRSREGAGGTDAVQYYQQAIARDPQNPFARAMWGHHIIQSRGSLEQAKAQFSAALTSGAERPYVRRMQFYAFLWGSDAEFENEVVRVANDVRIQGEALPPERAHDSLLWRLWNVYYVRLTTGGDTAEFLDALPAEDHLATFRWLYPESVVPDDKRHLYLFMLGQLLEHAGVSAEAVSTYRSLLELLQARGLDSPRLESGAENALRRLGQEAPPGR